MEIGDRVEISSHFDMWMRGDRFGSVTGIKKVSSLMEEKTLVTVRMDKSGGEFNMFAEDVNVLPPTFG